MIIVHGHYFALIFDLLVQSELSNMKEQLLSEFLPDDVCPLGAQFMDNPNNIYLVDSKNSKSQKEVITCISSELCITAFDMHNLIELCRLLLFLQSMMMLLTIHMKIKPKIIPSSPWKSPVS